MGAHPQGPSLCKKTDRKCFPPTRIILCSKKFQTEPEPQTPALFVFAPKTYKKPNALVFGADRHHSRTRQYVRCTLRLSRRRVMNRTFPAGIRTQRNLTSIAPAYRRQVLSCSRSFLLLCFLFVLSCVLSCVPSVLPSACFRACLPSGLGLFVFSKSRPLFCAGNDGAAGQPRTPTTHPTNTDIAS